MISSNGFTGYTTDGAYDLLAHNDIANLYYTYTSIVYSSVLLSCIRYCRCGIAI